MTLQNILILFVFVLAPLENSWSIEKNKNETQKLVVYTHRNEQLIRPLFEAYHKESGTLVEFLTGEPGPLLERIKAEGKNTPADIFISVDAGTLWQADKDDGLFEIVDSKILTSAIPAEYRSPNNTWFGLSLRARTIFYNKTLVKPNELKGYADLASPQWKGKLCLRTSKKVYNQSLVATLIEEFGEVKTKDIVKGWVSNLAHEVFENDTKLLEAIDAGKCHVGIANTYYLGRLAKDSKAKNVGVHFPENTHMNISGAGVLKHSKNKQEALKLLEWMTTEKAQKLFADSNMEYPVNAKVQPDPIVKAWGTPKHSKVPIYKAGELQRRAILMIDEVKYK
jgi:iron(III) transport system substrate-binding protein